MISPFDGPVMAGLYGDPEIAALFAGTAEVRAMLLVEGALARVQGELGIVPEVSARAIDRAAGEVAIDPATLADAMAGAGVPVAALVAAFRRELAPEHAGWVHWGATSQDILDTALALRLRRVLEILDERLDRLVAALAAQAETHRQTVIAARTRARPATPTTLGAKIAVWTMPLIRHRQRLAELRPRALRVSLGGASGTNAALQGSGAEVMRALAAALALEPSEVPWHAARDGIAELGGWLALVTDSLGKFGQDLVLLARTGEVTAGAGGASSTMPHKANPVHAEALVTLARLNASALGGLHQAMPHAEERDGAALALEWFELPAMCAAAGAATRLALPLAEGLTAHPDRIAATFAADRGLMLAEAAVFALAARMPRPQAQALVAEAVQAVRAGPGTLADALAERAPGEDWPRLLDPARQTGDAAALVDALRAAAASGRA
jgi:3-carboxy-cis,cis-muconate cycloisomerase